LRSPGKIRLDARGDILLLPDMSILARINNAGMFETIAGSPLPPPFGPDGWIGDPETVFPDGPALKARFRAADFAVGDDAIFIADTGRNTIRKIVGIQ
jgi:hypothetical protein